MLTMPGEHHTLQRWFQTKLQRGPNLNLGQCWGQKKGASSIKRDKQAIGCKCRGKHLHVLEPDGCQLWKPSEWMRVCIRAAALLTHSFHRDELHTQICASKHADPLSSLLRGLNRCFRDEAWKLLSAAAVLVGLLSQSILGLAVSLVFVLHTGGPDMMDVWYFIAGRIQSFHRLDVVLILTYKLMF